MPTEYQYQDECDYIDEYNSDSIKSANLEVDNGK